MHTSSFLKFSFCHHAVNKRLDAFYHGAPYSNDHFSPLHDDHLSRKVPPAVDRVTGHARGCAREWACPKLQSKWTGKFGFPFP